MGDASKSKLNGKYQDLALKGHLLRNLPTPVRDFSEIGSVLINSMEYNYTLKVDENRYDPVKVAKNIVGGAPFLSIFMALESKPPTDLISTFVVNPIDESKKNRAEATPYAFSTSLDRGLMIVHYAYKEKDKGNPREELFSEIMFRIWYEEVKRTVGNPKNLSANNVSKLQDLKYIIHEDIENQGTLWAMETAAKLLPEKQRELKANKTMGTECGFLITLKASSNGIEEQIAFNAILGSENGRGVVYLLNQHSVVFSGKSIARINLYFNADNEENRCILFEIGDLKPAGKELEASRLLTDTVVDSAVLYTVLH